MKSSLAHLPIEKQEQLQIVTKTILDKVPAEMIILFGSYARGDLSPTQSLVTYMASL